VHARLSTYEGPADGLDEMVQGFDQVTDRLRDIDGFEGGYVLVERSSGRAATITLWSSEQAAQASAQQADEMRTQVTQAGSHSVETVETYEVALRVDGG
jgi:heme-degrading monooxygenase HmoA